MATAYPISPAFSYPLLRTLSFSTKIMAGTTGAEQRISQTPGLETFELSYPRLTLAERDVMLSFFDTCKGAFAQDIAWTLGAESFTGLYLDEDRISVTERSLGQWEIKVRLCQTVRTPDTGALASDFPVLSTGARVQLPYTHERDFDTSIVKTEGGRFTWYNRAASRRTWTAGGSALKDSEALAIWQMFSRARGRWGAFGFTDPDSGVRYGSCRFDQDQLEWRYLGVNHNAIEVKITQAL